MPIVKGGRLAFRVEGSMWNCYYALPDTMEGAIYLGSIHMAIAQIPENKEAFMAIMRRGLNAFFTEQGAIVDHWKVDAAPEHERTKE